MNMATMLGTLAMCWDPTSYTREPTTTSACSDDTDGTTGTCNGSPTLYVPHLPSSAIKDSFLWLVQW